MARNPEADSLIAFLNASPTPFHAVRAAMAELDRAGARTLEAGEDWELEAGAAYRVERGGSTVAAFRLPTDPDPGALAFRLAAAHTDSPCLKLKPRPPEGTANYLQWGVEVYGGVLLNSWLDRDLQVAGRISAVLGGEVRHALVRLEGKALRVPQLAIHLDRGVNDQGLTLNPQRHLVPVLGLKEGGSGLWRELEALAREDFRARGLDLPPSADPLDPAGAPMAFDLHLLDAQPAGYGGLADEFVFSGRLDNLAMSHACLRAFCGAGAHARQVQAIALFDNEEVGSVSARGADSDFLPTLLERIALGLGWSRRELLPALARSALVSADMAHALHPNYPEKHEPNHFPLIGRGPVLKSNVGLRYASDSASAAGFRAACRKAGVPCQDFITRTDLACGTTIGPHLAAKLGMPTVDVGNPMLSMHSAREMAGAEDHGMLIRALSAFFTGV